MDKRVNIRGYVKHNGKGVVAFAKGDRQDVLYVTDGFKDKELTEKDMIEFVDKSQVNLKKIIERMRGARPWHPLLGKLRNELSA